MATTATATTGAEYVYSDTADVTSGARKRICEDIIYSQDPIDLPMRDLFGGYSKLPVDSIKIEHVEDNHMPIKGAAGTATKWNDGSTSSLPVVDGDKYMVGDIILINNEILVISDVDESGNTINVYARGDCGSDEYTSHTAADEILIIGNAQLEDFTYGSDIRFMTRTSKINYTQIFHDTLSVSKSYEEVPKFGIKSETQHQLELKLLRQTKLLELACLYSGISEGAAEGSASYPRSMCGIISQSSTASHPNIQTSTTDLGSVEVTEANLNTEMQEIFDAGGRADVVMTNSFNKKVISDFMLPYRRANMDDKKYGGVVSKFENDFGIVDLVLNRYMRKSDIVIMTKKDFGIGSLRPFKVIDLPDTKDSYRKELIGEYTCMLHNEEHNAWIYGTSTS